MTLIKQSNFVDQDQRIAATPSHYYHYQ